MLGGLRFILLVIITILIYKLVKFTLQQDKIKKFTNLYMNEKLKQSSNKIFSYEKIDKLMRKNGVYVMFENSTPSHYILTKLVFAITFMLIGIELESVLFSIAFFLFGYYLPNIIIKISNDEDNEKIMADLKEVYDTLRIQAKAGVFLTESLADCYLVARNKRLKKAFLELSGKIIANGDIEQAMIEFNSKFNNQYIDTFVTVVLQSLESGQTVQILEDLSEQIDDIQEVIDIKEKQRIQRKIDLIGLLIFIGILSIVLYGLFTELFSMLTNF